jgi:putative mycofactocin binding protein MftB
VSVTATGAFDVTRPWSLSPQVSLRDEAFGALAYHHVNRRLVFLKSLELVTLVRRLSEFDSAEAAVTELIDADQRARYLVALASLATSELLDVR